MSKEVVAPMPGTIINILVNVGDEVLEYQDVIILEAMKMENAIPSTEAGTVKEIKVQVNDRTSCSGRSWRRDRPELFLSFKIARGPSLPPGETIPLFPLPDLL